MSTRDEYLANYRQFLVAWNQFWQLVHDKQPLWEALTTTEKITEIGTQQLRALELKSMLPSDTKYDRLREEYDSAVFQCSQWLDVITFSELASASMLMMAPYHAWIWLTKKAWKSRERLEREAQARIRTFRRAVAVT